MAYCIFIFSFQKCFSSERCSIDTVCTPPPTNIQPSNLCSMYSVCWMTFSYWNVNTAYIMSWQVCSAVFKTQCPQFLIFTAKCTWLHHCWTKTLRILRGYWSWTAVAAVRQPDRDQLWQLTSGWLHSIAGFMSWKHTGLTLDTQLHSIQTQLLVCDSALRQNLSQMTKLGYPFKSSISPWVVYEHFWELHIEIYKK